MDPPSSRIPVRRYDSEAIAPQDRVAHWRERPLPSIARVFESTPEEPFRASSGSMQLGAVPFIHALMSSQSYVRTAAAARRDGVDHLAINVRIRGGARGDAGGTDFVASPGTIVLFDQTRPSAHVSAPSESILMTVPRAIAEARLGRLEHLHGLVIAPGPSALLSTYAIGLYRHAEFFPRSEAEGLSNVVLDLLSATLSAVGRRDAADTPDGKQAALRERAVAMIEQRLGSARLNVATLAAALGVSRATLYRLFADGGGAQAYIRRRRLEQVRIALANPREGMTIAMLAERWGFSDASHVARAFREEYGVPPTHMRG